MHTFKRARSIRAIEDSVHISEEDKSSLIEILKSDVSEKQKIILDTIVKTIRSQGDKETINLLVGFLDNETDSEPSPNFYPGSYEEGICVVFMWLFTLWMSLSLLGINCDLIMSIISFMYSLGSFYVTLPPNFVRNRTIKKVVSRAFPMIVSCVLCGLLLIHHSGSKTDTIAATVTIAVVSSTFMTFIVCSRNKWKNLAPLTEGGN